MVSGRMRSVPTTTGTHAAGNVRGRAARTQRRYSPGSSIMVVWGTLKSRAFDALGKRYALLDPLQTYRRASWRRRRVAARLRVRRRRRDGGLEQWGWEG